MSSSGTTLRPRRSRRAPPRASDAGTWASTGRASRRCARAWPTGGSLGRTVVWEPRGYWEPGRSRAMTDPIPEAPRRAAFNPLIRPYLVLYGAMILTMTVIGIPLAVLWLLGVGQWWARHYFALLECELGATALRFRKGIIFQVERTIPLENIQDVTFIEGPLLKRFHLSVLKFETAGQSHGQAHAMSL